MLLIFLSGMWKTFFLLGQKIKFPFSRSLAQELWITQPETNIKYSLQTLPLFSRVSSEAKSKIQVRRTLKNLHNNAMREWIRKTSWTPVFRSKTMKNFLRGFHKLYRIILMNMTNYTYFSRYNLWVFPHSSFSFSFLIL